MYNLYFPICGFMIELLILIAFYNKNSIINKETKCYQKLILIGFFESLLACIIVIMAVLCGTLNIAYVTNKIDYILILFWIWYLFNYVLIISFNESQKIENIKKGTFLLNCFVSIAIFFLNINLINENGIIDTNGASTSLIMGMAVLYLVSIIIIFFVSLKTRKRENRNKYLPVMALILLFLLMVIIRSVRPEIILLSYIISYINLIMFFTIENPDRKLVEEIAKSKEYADNSNAEKTYFVYNMSQEIRNPMKNISNIVNELNSISKKDEMQEKIDLLNENISQVNGVINNVFDISSMDVHNIEVTDSNYSIELIIKEIITKFQTKINSDDIEFRTVIDKNLPSKLYGDAIRIKQIINTVLNNSLKYTKEGFIELNISKVIKNDICRLIIVVEDSGSGILTNELETIFNKDKRENENNLLSEKYSDELNLANVRKILNIMGGTILLNSQIKQGTKVTIVLDQKIVDEEVNSINKIVNDYNKVYINNKVLIIDDNESSIKLLTKILEKYKLQVTSVMDVKNTLKEFDKNLDYSLIFLDDTLGDYNGFEVFKKLKEKNSNIPIVVTTRKTKLQYYDEYINNGFDDYLEKPIAKEELIKVLNKFLNNDDE